MGGGAWDSTRYYDDSFTRKSAGVDDFAYSKVASVVHPALDPRRINGKPFGKLESRDSVEHPDSNAILVGFDVTGSNHARAIEAQKALPNLMTLLPKYIADPQVAVAANDDYFVEPYWCMQISDFESDNRVDEHIRNIKLVGNGGGNGGESYDLILYAAARKVVADCFEKRGRKGYLFLYADERFWDKIAKNQIADIFEDKIPRNIPIEEIIEEAKKMWHIFLVSPAGGVVDNSYDQYVELFGRENVLILEHPSRICELIGVTIGVNEDKIGAQQAMDDLVGVGISKSVAASISKSLVPLANTRSVAKVSGSGLPAVGGKKKGGAARL